MPRVLLTDEFSVKTLGLLPGESYKVDLVRVRKGEEKILQTLCDLDPISDAIQIRVTSQEIIRELIRIHTRSEQLAFRRQGRGMRVSFVPSEDRVDVCPGDVIFVIGPSAAVGEHLSVHEVRMSSAA